MITLQHKTTLGDRTFYINKTSEGSYNYNSVNNKTNRTFHYSTPLKYYKAFNSYKKIKLKKEKLNKHRANLDKMRYESYVNFSNSYNLK